MTGDFLRATVVTRGWNGYRNKSQHRKSTLEKKILPPFQQGFEPATFQSRVRCSNHWAIPAPPVRYYYYWSPLYTAILCSRTDSLRSFHERSDYPVFLIFTDVGVLTTLFVLWRGWCQVKLVPSRRKFCVHHTTICTSLQCHFTQSYIGRCMCI